MYSYDTVFGGDSSNKVLYKSIKPIVDASVDGMNGTVFMYGQTGSGKTYSMIGDAFKMKNERRPSRSGSRRASTTRTPRVKRKSISKPMLPPSIHNKAQPKVIPPPSVEFEPMGGD